jgi:hypothetical protein
VFAEMKEVQVKETMVNFLIFLVIIYAMVLFWPYFLLKAAVKTYFALGQWAGMIFGATG